MSPAKTLLTLLLPAALLLLAACEKKDNRPLRLVTAANYAPYEFRMDGKVVGADIEIAKLVAESLGRPLEVQTVSLDEIFDCLESGRADFSLSALTVSAEREKHCLFSKPYVRTGLVIVSLLSNPLPDIPQGRSQVAGVELGSTAQHFCLENGIVFRTYPTPHEADVDLIDGRLDYVLADASMARSMAIYHPELGITSGYLTEDHYAAAVPRTWAGRQLLKTINKILNNLEKHGEIQMKITEWTRISDEQSISPHEQ